MTSSPLTNGPGPTRTDPAAHGRPYPFPRVPSHALPCFPTAPRTIVARRAPAWEGSHLSLGYSPSDPARTLLGAIDNVTVANPPLDRARAWTNTCVEQP